MLKVKQLRWVWDGVVQVSKVKSVKFPHWFSRKLFRTLFCGISSNVARMPCFNSRTVFGYVTKERSLALLALMNGRATARHYVVRKCIKNPSACVHANVGLGAVDASGWNKSLHLSCKGMSSGEGNWQESSITERCCLIDWHRRPVPLIF